MPDIPVARPWLEAEEAEAASRVILSGWVTQGPEVLAFEREFAAYVGADHACAVSNCTVGLFLALTVLGVKAGDEVITVSHSFIATANAIRHCGARVVFVDIDPATGNLDPALLPQAIGPRTRAVLAVHQVGMPCDMQAILAVTRPLGIAVIEDAACAIGSELLWNGRWEKIGVPHGDVACFSFHPRKLLTTGDGGMLTTSNPELDSRFRLLRQHSMSVTDTARHEARTVVLENYSEPGYNFRMTDIQAAVGREQLKRLPVLLERRRRQVERYRRHLAGLPEEPSYARTNWQSLVLRLPPGAVQIDVMQALLDRGISTRRGIMCSHREPAWPPGSWTCQPGTDRCPEPSCSRLLHGEQAQDGHIIIPLFHQLDEAGQDAVLEALQQVCPW